MGIFQEAAIIAGDFITQPIRKKVIELLTGREVIVRKVVEEGALISDDSIRPELGPGGAIKEAWITNEPVIVRDYHAKRVNWQLELDDVK